MHPPLSAFSSLGKRYSAAALVLYPKYLRASRVPPLPCALAMGQRTSVRLGVDWIKLSRLKKICLGDRTRNLWLMPYFAARGVNGMPITFTSGQMFCCSSSSRGDLQNSHYIAFFVDNAIGGIGGPKRSIYFYILPLDRGHSKLKSKLSSLFASCCISWFMAFGRQHKNK
jgi:hypothetical protein